MDPTATILRATLAGRPLAETLAEVAPPGLDLPALDLERHRAASLAWLRRLLRKEPPPTDLAGLWFGLFHPVRGGEASTDLYLCGAQTFDLDSVSSDWASGARYFPEGRYAHSEALASFHRAGEAAGVDPQNVCLAYAASLVGSLLDAVAHLLPEGLGVAVGWDSGTPLYLGFLRDGALERRDPDPAVQALLDGLADEEAWLEQPRLPVPDDITDDTLRAWGRKVRAARLAFFAARAAARRARD